VKIRDFWANKGRTPGCAACQVGGPGKAHSVQCKTLQRRYFEELERQARAQLNKPTVPSQADEPMDGQEETIKKRRLIGKQPSANLQMPTQTQGGASSSSGAQPPTQGGTASAQPSAQAARKRQSRDGQLVEGDDQETKRIALEFDDEDWLDEEEAEFTEQEMLEAKQKELKSLQDFGVYSDVQSKYPADAKTIGTRWVMTRSPLVK
jgi:hypothetical protein